jgi:hypothetical protein
VADKPPPGKKADIALEGQSRTTEVLRSANKYYEFGTVWLPDYSACGHTSLKVEFVAFMHGCDAIFERGGEPVC